MLLCVAGVAQTVTPSFPIALKNVVVIVQENRTPDNLFHFISPQCVQNATTCMPAVTSSCYDVSNCGLSNQSGTDVPITLTGVPMKGSVDPSHAHTAFVEMCDADSSGNCQMDGAWQIVPSDGSYAFVKNPAVTNYDGSAGHLLDPYLTFAETYGWANKMYQTNQGPSYPAHQFLFSGTSALGATDDSNATFVSENFSGGTGSGCLASSTAVGRILTPTPTATACASGCTCFYGNTVQECPVPNVLTGSVGTYCVLPPASGGHKSMAGLLDPAGISWKYYAPSAGSIWTAPNAIKNICEPAFDSTGKLFCSGTEWNANVDVANLGTDILTDITNCNLSNVSWVIPNGTWSDHAGSTDDYGPSWVAAVINAIGNNPTCAAGTPDAGQNFWQNTAIIVTWDDWGGWSDNQPPVILTPKPPCTSLNCPGDYQYGFRVPLLVVSAYTPSGYINNATHDFGTILRMIEDLNGLGRLGFADTRANGDLVDFFSLTTARTYTTVVALKDASFFLAQAAAGVASTAPDEDE